MLDKLYAEEELTDGAQITVPFKGKGGKVGHWNAIFVKQTSSATATSEHTTAATALVKAKEGVYTISEITSFNNIIRNKQS